MVSGSPGSPPAVRRLALLIVVAAASAAILARPAAAGFSVIGGTPKVSTTVNQLTQLPWYTRSQGMDWVTLLYPGESQGDNFGSYNCAAATRPAATPACDNSAWAAQTLTGTNPFAATGLASYNPFASRAQNAFFGRNDCADWATCLSTQRLEVQAGGNLTVYYAVDVAYQATTNAAFLELVLEETTSASVATVSALPVKYFTRNTSLPGSSVSGYTLLPNSGTTNSYFNVMVKMVLGGGSSYKWGFRSKGSNGAAADNWLITRAFFGCVGTPTTSVTRVSVAWNDTSSVLQSGVSASLPDTSTVPADSVTWEIECYGVDQPSKFVRTGYVVNLTVGGAGSDIVVNSVAFTCVAGFTATTSLGCPTSKLLAIDVDAAPQPTPVVSGLPATSDVTGPYPQTFDLIVESSTPTVGDTTYNWTIDCDGFSTTVNGTNYTLTVGTGGVNVLSPYGNKECQIQAAVNTITHGVTTTTVATRVFKAPPKAQSKAAVYKAPTTNTNIVVIDVTPTLCANEPCASEITIACPNRALVVKNATAFNGTAKFTAGGGEEIDPTLVPVVNTPTECIVTVATTDALGISDSADAKLIVYPQIKLPLGALGGIPSGGAGIPGPWPKDVNFSVSPAGIIGTPNITWTLECPKGSGKIVDSGSGPSPDFTTTVGPQKTGKGVNPLHPYGNKACELTVSISTEDQGTLTQSRDVSFLAPAVANLTGAPYKAGPWYPDEVNLDGSATQCANPPCTYEWTVNCPNKSPIKKSAQSAVLGISGTGDIDPSTLTETANCTVTLDITDSGSPKQRTSVDTSLTLLSIPVGTISGLPVGGSVGLAGPYPKELNMSINTTAFPPGSTYDWTLTCDGTSVKSNESTPDWSVVIGPGLPIDPFKPYGNKDCNAVVKVTTPGGGTLTYSHPFTILAPPAGLLNGAPYQAGPGYPDSVQLDGSGVGCSNPPCTYTWTIACPGFPAIVKTGELAAYTVGDGSGVDPGALAGPLNCSVALNVTDSGSPRQSTTLTSFTTVLPTAPGGITGLPVENGTAVITGPYPSIVNVSANSTGFTDPPTFNWSMVCPNVSLSGGGPTPNWSFPVGEGLALDPFEPYGNKHCNMSVTVSTPSEGSVTYANPVVVLTPTLVNISDGPLVIGPDYPDSVELDANSTACANPPCSFKWIVTCPDGQVVEKEGALATVTASTNISVDGGNLHPSPEVGIMNCTVEVRVTDSGFPKRTASRFTTLAVFPVILIQPGEGGLPFVFEGNFTTRNGTGVLAGPYPRKVSIKVNTTGVVGKPTFTWTLECPPNAPYTANTAVPEWEFEAGAGQPVDPFNPYGNKLCNLTLNVSSSFQGGQLWLSARRRLMQQGDGQQDPAFAKVNALFLAPPVPALAGAPYEAGPSYPTTVLLDGRATKCANPPCTYQWAITCPDRSPVVLLGSAPDLPVGSNGLVNPFSPEISAPMNCSVNLKVSDAESAHSEASIDTYLTVQPKPQSGVGGGDGAGGPYTISSGGYATLSSLNATTNCKKPACTYQWTVACPSNTVVKDGLEANVTAWAIGTNATGVAPDFNTFELTAEFNCTVNLTQTDVADATTTVGTTVLTVKPSPPSCTSISFQPTTSPGNIRALSKAASCATKKAIRLSKSTKNAYSIQVNGFKDPQGFDVVTNITSVITNQGEAHCPCVRGTASDCECVPDAKILNGGRSARVVPVLTPRRDAVLAKRGRQYVFRFVGLSLGTGLTCTGDAFLCVVKQPKNLRGRPAPKCAPFDNTWTVRDATKCLNFTAARSSFDDDEA